jgi:hypothetical protein
MGLEPIRTESALSDLEWDRGQAESGIGRAWTACEAAIGDGDDLIDERRWRFAALQVRPHGRQGRVGQDELGKSQASLVDAAPGLASKPLQARLETSRLIGDTAREWRGGKRRVVECMVARLEAAPPSARRTHSGMVIIPQRPSLAGVSYPS